MYCIHIYSFVGHRRHANAGARREEEGVIEENVLKHRHATAVNAPCPAAGFACGLHQP